MYRVLFFVLLFAMPLRAVEVQNHGYQWEKWVRDTFFEGYQGGYTDV